MEDIMPNQPVNEGDMLTRYIKDNWEDLRAQCMRRCTRIWKAKVDWEEAFQETCMSLTRRPVEVKVSPRALFFTAFRHCCERLAKKNAGRGMQVVPLGDGFDPKDERQTERAAEEVRSAVSREFLGWFQSLVPEGVLGTYLNPVDQRAHHHLPRELVRWVIAQHRTLSDGQLPLLEDTGRSDRFPREYLRCMHVTLKADRYVKGSSL